MYECPLRALPTSMAGHPFFDDLHFRCLESNDLFAHGRFYKSNLKWNKFGFWG